METVNIYKGIVGGNEGKLAIVKHEATVLESAAGTKVYWLDGCFKLTERELERERYNNVVGNYSFCSFDKEKVIAWVEKRKEKQIAKLKRLMAEYENAKIKLID